MSVTDGHGVRNLVCMRHNMYGSSPSLAAAKYVRDPPKMAPLREPMVELATKSGITRVNLPSVASANDWHSSKTQTIC